MINIQEIMRNKEVTMYIYGGNIVVELIKCIN